MNIRQFPALLLAFLVYVYYSSQILFIGGEFTQGYARTQGSHQAQDADAAAATGSMIGLVGGALLSGVGLVVGLARGAAKLRGR